MGEHSAVVTENTTATNDDMGQLKNDSHDLDSAIKTSTSEVIETNKQDGKNINNKENKLDGSLNKDQNLTQFKEEVSNIASDSKEEESANEQKTPKQNKEENLPIVPKEKEKKLTLQERLALVAKTKTEKSKMKKKSKENSIQEKSKLNQTFENNKDSNNNSDMNENSNRNEDYNLSDLIPDVIKDKQREDLINQLKKIVDDKVNQSITENSAKISKLENQLNASNRKLELSVIPKDSDLLNKLKEKDIQIQNLLEEGTKLSKKELLLNQSVKKLKQRESELEDDNEQYEKTIDELTNKLAGLEKKMIEFDDNERALVEERLALQTLKSKYDSLVRANDSLTDELKEIKFSKFDVQLSKALKDLDEERVFKSETLEKYEKLQSLFDQTVDEKQSTINDLESQLKIERNKVLDISRDSESEIKRLGEKIETLRFQNENSINTERSSNDIEVLQMQYDQAQENWKVIESSYLKKISNFEIQIEELTNSNIIYSKKIKVLTNDLKQKSSLNNDLKENEKILSGEIDTLKKKTALLTSTNETLVENIKQLKDEFNKEKENFEEKIKTLEEEKENLENSLKLRSNDFNSSQMINQNSFYLQDLSSSSSLNHMKPFNNSVALGRSSSNKRFSISVGESSTTPRLSTSNSSFSIHKLNGMGSMSAQDRILRHQTSIISLDNNDQSPVINNDLNHTPFLTDSASFQNLSQEFLMQNDDIPLGMDAESEHVSTLNGSNSYHNINNINGNMNTGLNIQLIKKLSGHVRMLELEVNTLKDEIKTLENEKDAASEEILKLIEDNSQVQNVRDEIKRKQDEIENLEKNYQKVLVLLGEKEERVGELTADVDDLKDLLRQQVQQMVDMQEKINQMSSKK